MPPDESSGGIFLCLPIIERVVDKFSQVFYYEKMLLKYLVCQRIFAYAIVNSLILVLCYAFFLCQVYAAESSCVKCHTNENILKTLHKPTKTESAEGEG